MHQLTTDPTPDWMAAWSPNPATDGERLFFTWNDDVGDLWVMDVSRERRE